MFLLERKEELDRIDKVLLVFPLLPVADLLSTLFALSFGGEEVGLLARPILQNYGTFGLVMLATSASIMFLFFMQVVMRIKKLFFKEWKHRWMWYILSVSINWFFMLQAVYFSTVIMNFLVPLSFQPTQTIILRTLLACTYFACVSALTMSQMRQLPHF